MTPDEEREDLLITLANWKGRAEHAVYVGKKKDPPNTEVWIEASEFIDLLDKMMAFVKQSS